MPSLDTKLRKRKAFKSLSDHHLLSVGRQTPAGLICTTNQIANTNFITNNISIKIEKFKNAYTI